MYQILILTDSITNRVSYIFKVLLKDFLNISYSITTNKEEFDSYSGNKITYLKHNIKEVPFIPKSSFFDITNIDTLKFSLIHNDIHVTLKQNSPSEITFDIFAACFYFLSRVEEYQQYVPDKHGRFSCNTSFLQKNDLALSPVVDIWTEQLKSFLQHHFANIQINQANYKPILSFDIDIAWAYKGKPFIRHYGNYIRDLINFDFQTFFERKAVIKGTKTDPFDVYDYIKAIRKQTNIEMLFFIHVRSGGKYDKAVSTKSKEFHHLIKELAEIGTIGIHPSYIGGQNSLEIRKEKEIIEQITKQTIICSRQHFLKLHIPQTLTALEKAGIKEDYTMGFANGLCWRAGTTKPFQVFDINNDRAMSLNTHLVSVMDGTLHEYLQLAPAEAMIKIKEILQISNQYKGEFIALWHNETISNHKKWANWKEKVFEVLVDELQKNTDK